MKIFHTWTLKKAVHLHENISSTYFFLFDIQLMKKKKWKEKWEWKHVNQK